LEELGNLFVPEHNVSLAIVNYGPKLALLAEVNHKFTHAVDGGDEVDDF
jgi:hypothetical protein